MSLGFTLLQGNFAVKTISIYSSDKIFLISIKEGPIMSKWFYNSVPAFSNYLNVE